MVTVNEATRIIMENLFKPHIELVRLEEITGRVLAETIKADRDFPPFDRVTMDGIALRFSTWSGGQRLFTIEGIQTAGEGPRTLSDPRNCIEVMTGAVLPSGCDTVVRYEDIEINDGRATVEGEVVRGQSIHAQGIDIKEAEILLEPGGVLDAPEVALIASVGRPQVKVLSMPRVAIISTGNELVQIDVKPQPFQIRASNAYAIHAALKEMNIDSTMHHLVDDRTVLVEKIEEIAKVSDVLILSGGVSKGKLDFVPDSLGRVGFQKMFHQVSQRPGKPLWFGTHPGGKVAFALPGNPVSTFMCFHRYVKPWLQRSLGIESPMERAILASNFRFDPPLTHFLQVEVRKENGELVARPQAGGGSGDFVNLSRVNGFLELPLEKSEFHAGEAYPFYPFRR